MSSSALIYLSVMLLVVGVAVNEAKPVSSGAKKVRTTTPAAVNDDDALNDLLNAGLMSLGNGVTCDSWIDSKMKELNTNIDDLAKMIVDAEPKELALEFIVFCLMDDQPMSDRPSMLKSAIDDEKAQTVVTTPKPVKSHKASKARKF